MKGPRVPVVFLDRDGTLVKEPSGSTVGDDVILGSNRPRVLSHVLKGLQLLSKKYRLFVVSNQDGINRGQLSMRDYNIQNKKLNALFLKKEIRIRAWKVCPHMQEEKCACIKPKTGMAKFIAKHFMIDWKNSFMIGDMSTDIQFGKRLKMKTILVKWNERIYEKTTEKPWKRCPNVLSAAHMILDKK